MMEKMNEYQNQHRQDIFSLQARIAKLEDMVRPGLIQSVERISPPMPSENRAKWDTNSTKISLWERVSDALAA